MKELKDFLSEVDLSNIGDMETLFAISDITRDLIDKHQYDAIGELIKQILEKKNFEALTWVVSIIQESFSKQKEKKNIKDFSIKIGREIENFDEFIKTMNIQQNPYDSSIQKILDKNGEVQSFFNILIYKTQYDNVYLVSAENFDTRDNDFIQYKLLCTYDVDKYIERMEKEDTMIEIDKNINLSSTFRIND